MDKGVEKSQNVFVLIPALNEEESIAKVIGDIPRDIVTEVVVIDNGSNDRTVENARAAGATVLHEETRGYGHALMKGINHIAEKDPHVIVFMDGDYSDRPEELPLVAGPILNDSYDMVIGSRVLGEHEDGALLAQARFGNWLATTLIRWFWGYRFTDLGPFRAIRFDQLRAMKMRELTYGWTVEMQIKAAKMKLRCEEVPVSYRKRIGKSKVSGTISGSVKAGAGILRTILFSLFSGRG